MIYYLFGNILFLETYLSYHYFFLLLGLLMFLYVYASTYRYLLDLNCLLKSHVLKAWLPADRLLRNDWIMMDLILSMHGFIIWEVGPSWRKVPEACILSLNLSSLSLCPYCHEVSSFALSHPFTMTYCVIIGSKAIRPAYHP
jgi:hypothetical protein